MDYESKCSGCKIIRNQMRCFKRSNAENLRQRIDSSKNEGTKKYLDSLLQSVMGGIRKCKPIK